MDRTNPGRWFPAVVLAGMSLAILAVLNPQLVLSSSTPTGGDMGAHVLGPAYLREVLLPSGRILGWSNSWFAGFPAFYFYFPLPSLVIVALDLILPYGVAFKLVTVAGLLALPPSAYYLARSLRLGTTVSLGAAAGATTVAFMESYSIYGANIASTLAGEFAYSWSFALGLIYLGLLVRAIRDDRRYVAPAAVVLAATALSHILTTLVLVVASMSVLLWRGTTRRAASIWGWGFAIAGFWAVPLAARIGLTSDMAWTPLRRMEEVFPIEIWLLLPAAVAGGVWVARRTMRVVPVLVATLLPVIYYPLPNLLPEVFPQLFGGQQWKLWNGRLLPYWYFGVAFFAGIALGAVVAGVARRLPARISPYWPRGIVALGGAVAVTIMVRSQLPVWAVVVVASVVAAAIAVSFMWGEAVRAKHVLSATAVAVLALGGLAGVTFVDGWSRWNYEGYEAKDPWPEYQSLMETIDGLPPGRVQWEANRELDKYGTPMSPMLIPYWTNWTHPSMEGLFFESSLTTPFHFLNAGEMSSKPSNPIPGLDYHTFDFDRGVEHLGLYGVRYYVTYTDEARTEADSRPELTKLADVPPFSVYELPPSDLVVVARRQPAVYEEPSTGVVGLITGVAVADTGAPAPSFHDLALDWYADASLFDRWITADGPDDWERISSLDDLADQAQIETSGTVSDVDIQDHRISFRTTAIGVPHLVKVSYFPNWKAAGAMGPFRATPSLMVVVPTRSDVVIEFRNTWAEWLGNVLTVSGLLALAGVPLWRRFRRTEAAGS